jgi:hypothetical protein
MNKRVDKYIKKQESPQNEICSILRKIILKTFPLIKEEMKWGVPAYGDGKYYFVALKTHVNLGFSIKGLSDKDIGNFKGNGKTMRHIEINSLKEIDEKNIVKLLNLVKD